jgi:hypothetical protein
LVHQSKGNEFPWNATSPFKSLKTCVLLGRCWLHTLKLITHSQPHIISSIEVAITIGIVPCPQSTGCPQPSAVGDVLYQGPYNPRLHGAGGNYQNFTVKIPFNADLIGKSLLTVNRFFLIGVSGFGLVVFSGSHADFF